ncbi:MAG: hypothetical protein GXP33_00710 [Spirochaetes bacterium]|nr:hypothetical protein [Spirochaetota bacterium]
MKDRKYNKVLFFIFIVGILICPGLIFAQRGFEFSLTSAAEIPLGPMDSDNQNIYSIGMSGSLTGEYPLGDGFFSAIGHLDYNSLPTTAEKSLSIISLGAGGALTIPLFPWLDFKAAVSGGYGLGLYEGKTGGSVFIKAGGRLRFKFSSAFALGLDGGYRYQDGLYSSVFTGLNANISLSGARKIRIKMKDIKFDPVFPVFYTYYNDNPIGSVKIINNEPGTIKNIRVSFFVQGYMDKPKLCVEIETMKKGQERVVPLYALFNKSILNITEGTKVNAEVKVSYDIAGEETSGEENKTLQVYDRNAMIWDDDRKAASFVTAKDPTVLSFGKRYGGLVRDRGSSAVSRNFRIGMGIFQALTLSDLNYVIDPTTPYKEFSKNKFAVDNLQFPVQTLQYNAGDCDDLSILFCALMESVGIETAFITVPAHIYAAFALELSEEEAKKTFRDPGSLIFEDGKVWVPVETTALNVDFIKAWNIGVSEWKKNVVNGKAKLLSIHSAWKIYDPVGFESEEKKLNLPTNEAVLASYKDTLRSFIEMQIHDRVNALNKRIKNSSRNSRLYNKLGVLYARFGFFDKAEEAFIKASKKQYIPAKLNLGNIYLIKGRQKEASLVFNEVLKKKPVYSRALAGLARAQYELKEFKLAENTYLKLKSVNPKLAERYEYISGGSSGTGRASEAVVKYSPAWDEE